MDISLRYANSSAVESDDAKIKLGIFPINTVSNNLTNE